MTRARILLPLALLGLLCAPARAEMSDADEIELGRAAAVKIERQYGISNDPVLNAKLQKVGRSLVPVCGRPELPYQFKLLEGKEFNAMALPGGFVYATRPLVEALPEGALAFALGHEIAHVTQRHSIHQAEAARWQQIGMLAVMIGLGGSGSGAGSLAQVLNQVMTGQHSQGDESEADKLGIATMARAGYDPAYSLVTLHALAERAGSSQGSFLSGLLGSHPPTQDRIDEALQQVPHIAFGNSGPAWGETLVAALREGCDWQPDPALQTRAAQALEQMQLDPPGWLLVCPTDEPVASVERRLLTRATAASPGVARRFGLAVRQAPNGELLVWVEVNS